MLLEQLRQEILDNPEYQNLDKSQNNALILYRSEKIAEKYKEHIPTYIWRMSPGIIGYVNLFYNRITKKPMALFTDVEYIVSDDIEIFTNPKFKNLFENFLKELNYESGKTKFIFAICD